MKMTTFYYSITSKWTIYSRFILLLLVVILALPAQVVFSAATLPQAYSPDRYQELWERSPFSVSMVVEVAPTQSGNWTLTGISEIDGNSYVTVTNKQSLKTISLLSGESLDGIKLIHAEWKSDYSRSFAIVEEAGKQQRLTFDQQDLTMIAARASEKRFVAQQSAPQNVAVAKRQVPTQKVGTSTRGNKLPPSQRVKLANPLPPGLNLK